MADLHVTDNVSIEKTPLVVRAMVIEILKEGYWEIVLFSEKPEIDEAGQGYYNILIF